MQKVDQAVRLADAAKAAQKAAAESGAAKQKPAKAVRTTILVCICMLHHAIVNVSDCRMRQIGKAEEVIRIHN